MKIEVQLADAGLPEKEALISDLDEYHSDRYVKEYWRLSLLEEFKQSGIYCRKA